MAIHDLTGPSVQIMLEYKGVMTPLESILGLGPGVNFIDNVSVKIGLGKILNMDITLDPTLDVALNILRKGIVGLGFTIQKGSTQKGTTSTTSGDVNAETAKPPGSTVVVMNKVAVRLWNGGLSSPWFKGLLFQPDIEIGPEGIHITMQAFGLLFEASKTYPKRAFSAGQSKLSIIKELLGNQVSITTTAGAQKLLSDTIKKERVSTKNNLETAKEYLSEWNCGMYMNGAKSPSSSELQGVRIFALSEPKLKKTSSAVFVAYRQIDPTNRVFPLLTFSSPIQNLLLPSGAFAGVLGGTVKKDLGGGVRIDSKETGAADLNQRSPATTGDTAGGGWDKSENSKDGGPGDRADQAQKPYPVVAEGDDFFDKLRGYVHDYVDKVFEYDISTVGIPDIFPGSRVKIAVSDIQELTGDFDVYDVEHTVGSSGFETKLHCVRTGGLAGLADNGLQTIITKTVDTAVSANKKISSTTGVGF